VEVNLITVWELFFENSTVPFHDTDRPFCNAQTKAVHTHTHTHSLSLSLSLSLTHSLTHSLHSVIADKSFWQISRLRTGWFVSGLFIGT
jgi:hypothetical protein